MYVFPFQHLKYIMPLLSGYKVSTEKSADSLMGIPLYVTLCFSLVAFRIL